MMGVSVDGCSLRRRQVSGLASGIEDHRKVRAGQIDAGLGRIGERHRIIHGAELARMLLVVGSLGNLGLHVVDHFVDIHLAVFVLVRRAFQRLQ